MESVTNRNSESPRSFMTAGRVGVIALAGIGGYLMWRNRHKIQSLLEESGISTTLMGGSVGEKVKSSIAKISGVVKHEANKPNSILSAAV